tara:strand:+ start:8112 stop:11681 length:3570 start_codon:yes stop_codon:yes gene_type:complete
MADAFIRKFSTEKPPVQRASYLVGALTGHAQRPTGLNPAMKRKNPEKRQWGDYKTDDEDEPNTAVDSEIDQPQDSMDQGKPIDQMAHMRAQPLYDADVDVERFRQLLATREGIKPVVQVDVDQLGKEGTRVPAVEEVIVNEPGSDVAVSALAEDVPTTGVEEIILNEPGSDVVVSALSEDVPTTAAEEIIVDEPGSDVVVSALAEDAPTTAAEDTAAIKSVKGSVPKPNKTRRRRKLVDVGEKGFTRKQFRMPKAKVMSLPKELVQIGDTPLAQRLGERRASVVLKQPSYYRDNREIFVNFINGLFAPYRKLLDEASRNIDCSDKGTGEFSLLAHQLIVRDYLNLYTPYRGLLLYHGLGSGKTCSSVAIAEGMKEDKEVIVMTPASLRMNYKEELKKCGDELYKKLQHWEFINATPSNIGTLSYVLKLPKAYIQKGKRPGAWLMNSTLPSNYDELPPDSKSSLDKQIDEMISYKYKFISYNGLRKNHIDDLTSAQDGSYINPFDDKVLIIDEAHNLVSMIVNKIGKEGEVATRLYDLIMSAKRARIVMLSGTPMINYPNELGIMFNMLRGYMRTWRLTVATTGKMVTEEAIKKSVFKASSKLGRVSDFVKYTPSTALLEVTRNPFGFVNKLREGEHAGVKLGVWGEETNEEFLKQLTASLRAQRISIKTYAVDNYKALPDRLDSFKESFLTPDNEVKNMNLFKRRILGLVSYFPDMYALMPTYDATQLHVEKIEMSQFQFSAYEEIRAVERKQELKNAVKRLAAAQKGIFEETTSTYRTFSRAFCNFVFPAPSIVRPFRRYKQTNTDEAAEEDIEIASDAPADDYSSRLKEAMRQLEENKREYLGETGLATYSPKMLRILQQLKSKDNVGLHLVYSQFRTVEGIGVLRLVLLANGFSEFKISRGTDGWELAMTAEELAAPSFALYTGTESDEEKEIVRRVYNGEWDLIPSNLSAQLMSRSDSNDMGQIIKVFMITAAGAEGINLKNTRYVHIMEPHWHPVRIEQVIGRARRICSHSSLPVKLRTVDVFIYLMTFSKKQLADDATIELRLKDVGRIDSKTPLTTDEALYEIATLKEHITKKLLSAVQEASIDCALHRDKGSAKKCVSFGTVSPTKYAYHGDISSEEQDDVQQLNVRTEELRARLVVVKGKEYAYNSTDSNLYDWESYKDGEPRQVGKLIKTSDGYIVELL